MIKTDKLIAAKPALERFVVKHITEISKVGYVIEALGKVGDEDSAQLLEKQLKAQLEKKTGGDRDQERLLISLISALADLKYTKAKPIVYETIFYLYSFDDTIVTNPAVMEIKEKLEKQLADKAREALTGLKNKSIRCLVFLENRKALAGDPKIEPRFYVLVRIDTTDSSVRNLTKLREAVAEALKVPVDFVGISCKDSANSSFVEGIDPRLDHEGGRFVFWKVCQFLRAGHDKNDDAFVRWLVENKYEKKGLVEELLPGILKEK